MRRHEKLGERTDSGYILVAVAASLVAFCAIIGLATDVGMLYFYRGDMQAAADTAAFAGAHELLRQHSGLVSSAAAEEATTNGFTDGVDGATVTVNNPPTSGDYNGNSKYVEVIVTKPEPTFFLRVLGINSADVAARAVAGLGTSVNCMYVLDPSSRDALTVNGSGAVLNVPCSIIVNSNDSRAMNTNGGACINAASLDITGSFDAGGCYTPTPATGLSPSDDPLLSLASPAAAATCDAAHTNWNQSSGTWSLTAGTYCGGITARGGAKVTLGAGTYILKGGGLSVTQAGTELDATAGVTFYNTCTSGACSSSTAGFKPMEIKSGAIVSVTAPNSGVYNNIIFFVDRAAPSSGPLSKNDFSNSTFNFDGSIYAASQQINMTGGAAASSLNLNIVAYTVNFTGNSSLNITHDFGDNSAIREVHMVE